MEQPPLPRVTIQFCTQCKWMLRAAYFAQELLSTFSTNLGEVALQPSTGGTFLVHLYHASSAGVEDEPVTLQKHLLWDRKAEGGFPETKELKRRVRDIIDPSRNLGHVDGHKKSTENNQPKPDVQLPNTTPISSTINRLQAQDIGERKFTPMDVDIVSRRTSEQVFGGEDVGGDGNGNGKIRVGGEEGGEGEGFCRPGDEDCG